MALLIYNLIFIALQVDSMPEPRNQPPPGPRLPIGDNIWILVFVGLIFGVYIVYKRRCSTNKVS